MKSLSFRLVEDNSQDVVFDPEAPIDSINFESGETPC